MIRDRHGLTIVELLVSVVIASILISAIFTVLVSSQRTYGVQGERIAGHQTVRAGADFLAVELRELSTALGDLVVLEEDRVQFRAGRDFAVACQVVSTSPNLQVRAWMQAGGFSEGDSVFVFSDGDPNQMSDDVWLTGSVASVGSSTDCADIDRPEVLITFSGLTPSAASAGVRRGAPIRGFEMVTYGLVDHLNDPYLGRTSAAGTSVPLLGPVATEDGVTFQYLDDAGAETAVASEVQAIRATVRTRSALQDASGRAVADSLSILVNARN